MAVHSTDEFFMTTDGCYDFQIDRLHTFHSLNLANFIGSLKSEICVVICDNVNIAPWQTKPYTDAARRHGYQIICITFAPRELEKHVQSQQVTPERPDAHGVPQDILVRFIEEYEVYSRLLDKSYPVDPEIHKDYIWDDANKTRVPTGKASGYFDVDYIIEILPDQYHETKKNIGKTIYGLLGGSVPGGMEE